MNDKTTRFTLRQLVTEKFLIDHLALPRVAIGKGVPTFHPYHDGIRRQYPTTFRLTGTTRYVLDMVSTVLGMRTATLCSIVVTHYVKSLLMDPTFIEEYGDIFLYDIDIKDIY